MLNAETILQAGGLLAVGLTIFAETGLLLGILLPGDTLLLTAGLFAGQGKLSMVWLNIVVIIAAFLGYQTGYAIGERAGPKVFKRKDGLLFREDYIERTNAFFKKYGFITLIFARVIANVRTIIPLVAGAGKMDKRVFMLYNFLGAVVWSILVTLLGYWVGSSINNADRYFFPVLVIGLIVIYAFVFWGFAKSPERRHSLKKGLREDWDYFFKHKK